MTKQQKQLKIINIMMGKSLGGIEQAAIDYAKGLSEFGHDVLTITHPKAAINNALQQLDLPNATIGNVGAWDLLTPARLGRLARKFHPDVIITHGNRAMVIAKKANLRTVPLISVSHNYRFSKLSGADAIFAVTNHMIKEIRKLKIISEDMIFHAPNMIEINDDENEGLATDKQWHNPPLIGAMGRFSPEKGFEIFIEAMAILKQREISFNAAIGGAGQEADLLKKLAHDLELSDNIKFTGWVENTSEFLADIDIFCVPSHKEAFGIILLEAMRAKLPIVATNCHGPAEIIMNDENAIIVDVGDATAIADGLENMINNQNKAIELGNRGYQLVIDKYSAKHRCEILSNDIENIIEKFHSNKAVA